MDHILIVKDTIINMNSFVAIQNNTLYFVSAHDPTTTHGNKQLSLQLNYSITMADIKDAIREQRKEKYNVEQLRETIIAQQKTIDELQNMIKYMPPGPWLGPNPGSGLSPSLGSGYLEAKKEFESLSK